MSYDQQHQRKRYYQGRGRDNYPQKKRYTPKTEDILKKTIVRLGDAENTEQYIERDIKEVADYILNRLNDYQDTILDIMSRCIPSLPHKIPMYGTVVGLVNVDEPEFGRMILEQTVETLQFSLMSFDFGKIKCLLRFLGELTNNNVLSPNFLIEVLESLVSVPDEMNVSQPRADSFILLSLQLLPWVGKILSEKRAEQLNSILQSIEQHISRRSSKTNQILRVFEDEELEDYLQNFWNQITKLKENGWEVSTIWRPYTWFLSKLSESQTHSLSTPSIPAHNDKVQYPELRGKFSIFKDQLPENLQPIDQFIVQDAVLDILDNFREGHRDGSIQIKNLCSPFSLDKLILDTLFSELFELPHPKHKEIYYGVIIQDLCKMKSVFAPLLGKAIFLLFQKLDKMDEECFHRFASWFSHHLSNFDFKWIWADWKEILDLPLSPKVTFSKEVIEKCLRLSYWDRIKATIPEEFQVLMPSKPETFPKYDESVEGSNLVTELIGIFRAKTPAEEIRTTVLEGENFAQLSEEKQINIVVHAFLKLGCKSLSHLLAVLERFSSIFSKYESQNGKINIMKSVAEFWKNSPQHILITIDKMMTYRVVDAMSIVQWIFSPGNHQSLTRDYLWDLFEKTLQKTASRLANIEKELKNTEANIDNIPQEEQTSDDPNVKRMQELQQSFEKTQNERRSLFKSILQNFANMMNQQPTNVPPDVQPYWNRVMAGRYKQICRKYHKDVRSLIESDKELEKILSANEQMKNVLEQIKDIQIQFT